MLCQIGPGIAQDEAGRFAFGILFRQKAGEDAPEFEIDVERPETELRLEPLERRVRLVRDQDIDAEALDPSVRAGAEPDRVRLLRDKLPVQGRVDPFGHFHGRTRAADALNT